MVRLLLSTAAYLLANGTGLLVASLLLDGFTIDFTTFVFAVALFSIIQVILNPLAMKMSMRHLPQLMGGVSLVVVFFGLIITEWLMPGFTVGGISNLLAATLLVWLGSLLATILIPIYVIKSLRQNKREAMQQIDEATTRANEAAARANTAAAVTAGTAAATSQPQQPAAPSTPPGTTGGGQ